MLYEVITREGGPFPRVVREVPPGAGPSPEGDLRRVQARDRLLLEPGPDEPRLPQLGARPGLHRGAHLRHLPHVV